jgi:hypothetical protein
MYFASLIEFRTKPIHQPADAFRILTQNDESGDNENPTRHDRQDQTYDPDQDEGDACGDAQNLPQRDTPVCGIRAF